MQELANLISPPDKTIVDQMRQYAPSDVMDKIEKEESTHRVSKKDFF